jgi:hypothetical protein
LLLLQWGRRCGQERGCYELIAQPRLIAVATSESPANFPEHEPDGSSMSALP